MLPGFYFNIFFLMKKKLVVLTGAGISAESGISTFRDSGGLWEKYSVDDVCTPDGYRRNPRLVIDFYNARRKQLLSVQPNHAHIALAELESMFNVTVITQNVDNLHERAGSSHIIHLHGELEKVTSSINPNDSRQIRKLSHENYEIHIGDKASDGSQLRPYIVWFGEPVPNIGIAADYVSEADILLIIGTSLNVYPAAGLLNYAPDSALVYLIDPAPVQINSWRSVNVICKGASEGIDEFKNLVSELL